MQFEEYQEKAASTDLKTSIAGNRIVYYVLGLVDEAGEVAGKIKKLYRDKEGKLDDEYKKLIAKELGDVLWYLSALSRKLGFSLSQIAEMNLNKLNSRKERGMLKGNGDNR